MEWSSWNALDLSYCLFAGNADDGLFIWTDAPDFHVYNSTFVGNETGMRYDWNFPKKGNAPAETPQATSVIENCLFAYNTSYGLYSSMFPYDVNLYCNDAFGNGSANYLINDPPYDSSNNFAFHPLLCDTASGDFHVAAESRCAPAHNPCSVLIGAFDVGCTCCVTRGDIDHGGGAPNVADLTYIVNLFFRGGPPAPCREEADVNGNGGQPGVADLTYLVDYLFRGGPPPVPCP
jgi:hypothetical protein